MLLLHFIKPCYENFWGRRAITEDLSRTLRRSPHCCTLLYRGSQTSTWTLACKKLLKSLPIKLISAPVLAFRKFDQQYIVNFHESSVAVGTVLSQNKEDGKLHSVQFARSTVNTSERNYSAWEREARAVIFALKEFRVYLLSLRPFKLVTGPHALQNTFKKKDVYGQLERCVKFNVALLIALGNNL